jgi:hypothetical protein
MGPSTWIARARWRAGLAARDGLRLGRLLLRAARTAVAGDDAAPGLSILVGPPTVRAGAPSTYAVGICNPTSRDARLRLLVQGSSSAARIPAFHVEASIAVPAHALVAYRVSTQWDGRASLTPAPATDAANAEVDPVTADAPEHCDVDVHIIREQVALDHLRVRAALVG